MIHVIFVCLLQERGLSAYPFIEICKGDLIHYMCPLENQDSFFVPELLEKQTDGQEEMENERDADDTHTGMTLMPQDLCFSVKV